ncbi:hypothetical protein WJX81_006107 [Elliptochloris bilobata]|uniref:Fungal lipase-type domain-containing protein n=1 Tax=Elliptochloris bilobata TaxID=381761 RepID=A0AAW1RFZ2_9CHLO
MNGNPGQPTPASALRLSARDGLAAAKRLWNQELPSEEQRGGKRARRGETRRSRMWQAVATRLWRRVGLDARSLRPLCRAFALDNLEQLQDTLNCLVLSEAVYKVVDYGDAGAADMLAAIVRSFPPSLLDIRRVQWAQPHSHHRYLLAEAGDALVVTFMGTKQRRDLLTNANLILEPVWPQDVAAGPLPAVAAPSAHRGFLNRARSVPIESLYDMACRQGRRLVLTGHSLGGAVAALTTLRLLRQLPAGAAADVRCVSFAAPAIGNARLQAYVREQGWDRHFSNLLVPEDVVPRLLGGPQAAPMDAEDAPMQPTAPPAHPGDAALGHGAHGALEWESAAADGSASAGASDDWAVVSASLDDSGTGGDVAAGMSAVVLAPDRIAEQLPQPQPAPPPAPRRFATARRRAAAVAVASSLRLEPSGSSDRSSGSSNLNGAIGNGSPSGSGSGAPSPSEHESSAVAAAGDGIEWELEEAAEAGGGGPAGGAARWGMRAVGSTAARAGSVMRGAQRMGALGARVGAGLAGAGVRRAAHIAFVPFRAAQLNYLPIGRQLYLFPHAVATSMRAGAVPGSPAGPHAPQRLPEAGPPSAAAPPIRAPQEAPQRRTPQPFTMHKMAFHRGRVLGILRRALRASLPLDAAEVATAEALLADAACDDMLAALAADPPPDLEAAAAAAVAGFASGDPAEYPQAAHKAAGAGGHTGRGAAGKRGASLLSAALAPALRVRSAETWVEWALPGEEDVRQIVDDLASLGAGASLSKSGAAPGASSGAASSANSGTVGEPGAGAGAPPERWQWLRPWAWISGLGWRSRRREADVALDVHVRGAGLETATVVRVHALGEVWCRAEVVQRPQPPAPARVYATLRPDAPDVLRTAALAARWLAAGARQALGALDRRNIARLQRDLRVRVWVPAAVMRRAQARLVAGGPREQVLTVELRSDFHAARVPLEVHTSGTFLYNDLQRASQQMAKWLAWTLTRGA